MVPLSETASSTQLTLSWRRPLSYRNQSIDLQSKSMDWFLYDNGPRHERVKRANSFNTFKDDVKKHYLTWIIHNVYMWIRVSVSIYVCMSLGVCIYTYGYLLVCFPLIYPFCFFSRLPFSLILVLSWKKAFLSVLCYRSHCWCYSYPSAVIIHFHLLCFINWPDCIFLCFLVVFFFFFSP